MQHYFECEYIFGWIFGSLDYNEGMKWVRRGFVSLLSLVLLATLLGTAFSSSMVLNLREPSRVENWLNQSRLYDRFVATIAEDSQEPATDEAKQDTSAIASTAASDAVVKKAAESAFSPQLVRQSAQTIISSNYAWLEGKTERPEFTIDLSEAKLSFAKQVGAYVRTYSAKLAVCTPTQLAELQNRYVDPLTATCRPPSVTPEDLGAETTRKLSTSGEFLSNPVVTPKTLNPRDDKGGSQPYYEKLAKAPEAYQLGLKMPWILGGLSVVTAVGIIFLSSLKRRGWRRVGIIIALAGVILIAVKFVADYGFTKLEDRVFNASTDGQLEQSLTDFAHRVEAALVKTDLLFGIAFLALAVIIFAVMFRNRSPKIKESVTNMPAKTPAEATSQTNSPVPPLKPTRPKRPRLIQ